MNTPSTQPVVVREPAGAVLGAVIMAHEIFGLTPHILSVCDRLSQLGYRVVAPDLFAPHVQGCLPYTPEGKASGLAVKTKIGEQAMADTLASLAREQAAAGLRVGVIGFCLGGTLAWLAGANPSVSCVVGYYAVGMPRHLESKPGCPVMMHFGRTDPSIPASDVAALHAAWPQVEIHEYDAGHAFNRDDDKPYEPVSAALAWDRTAAFLRQHLQAEK